MIKKKKTTTVTKTVSTPKKTTFMEELVERPIIVRDFPHALEAFNKMTNKERIEWINTNQAVLREKNVPQREWGNRLGDMELDFQSEYNKAKNDGNNNC